MEEAISKTSLGCLLVAFSAKYLEFPQFRLTRAL
jgi:hypothetical protein